MRRDRVRWNENDLGAKLLGSLVERVRRNRARRIGFAPRPFSQIAPRTIAAHWFVTGFAPPTFFTYKKKLLTHKKGEQYHKLTRLTY